MFDIFANCFKNFRCEKIFRYFFPLSDTLRRKKYTISHITSTWWKRALWLVLDKSWLRNIWTGQYHWRHRSRTKLYFKGPSREFLSHIFECIPNWVDCLETSKYKFCEGRFKIKRQSFQFTNYWPSSFKISFEKETFVRELSFGKTGDKNSDVARFTTLVTC